MEILSSHVFIASGKQGGGMVWLLFSKIYHAHAEAPLQVSGLFLLQIKAPCYED